MFEVRGTTDSSSHDTGCARIWGGLGVYKNINAGGTAHGFGAASNDSTLLWVNGASGSGAKGFAFQTAGVSRWSLTAAGSETGSDVGSDLGLYRYLDAGTQSTVLLFSRATGAVSVGSSVASTSSTTGSLVVAGGVGVGGDLYAGGSLVAASQAIKSGATQLIRKPSGLALTTQIYYVGQTIPAAPAVNDFWEEHSAAGRQIMVWQWDGTYWKSCALFVASSFSSGLTSTTGGWYSSAGYPMLTWSGVWVEACEYSMYLSNAGSDALNYWTLQSLKASTNSAYTALHSAYQTPVLAAGSRCMISIPATDQYMPFSGFFQFRYSATKVLLPGTLVLNAAIVYRIVR